MESEKMKKIESDGMLQADKPKRGRPRKAESDKLKQGVSGKTGGASKQGVSGKKKGVGVRSTKEQFEAMHKDTLKPPVAGRHGVLQPNLIEAPDGKNAQYLNCISDIGRLPWIEDWNDIEALNRNATKYFEICAKWDCKPGVAGLALALKMDRRRFWEIVNDQPRAPKISNEAKDVIKFYHQYLNALWEQMLQGGINPAAGIFLGINNFGYHNEQNIVVHPVSEKTEADIEAIEAKYSEIPD